MNKFTGTYFVLVEHTKKDKRVRSLEAMPLYLKDQLNTREKVEQYFEDQYGYVEPKVRYDRIKMYSLIKVDGFYLYLTGRSGVKLLVSNAVQLKLEKDIAEYVRKITKNSMNNNGKEHSTYDESVTCDKNIKLYNHLLNKHLNQIYSKRPNPVGEKLKVWKDKFIGLTLQKQIYVLLQILQLSQLINQGADLTDIGGVKKTGVATLNKVISDKKEFKLINQSITGLYENEIDLLSV